VAAFRAAQEDAVGFRADPVVVFETEYSPKQHPHGGADDDGV
jgi:hypothetical protein